MNNLNHSGCCITAPKLIFCWESYARLHAAGSAAWSRFLFAFLFAEEQEMKRFRWLKFPKNKGKLVMKKFFSKK
jgi:hypothetical protein